MTVYCYDIECFSNFFSATFVDVTGKEEPGIFYITPEHDQSKELIEFLNTEMTLVGYNNDSYDNPMLRYLMAYKGPKINTALHNISKKLIDSYDKDDKVIMSLRYPRDIHYSWKSVDLMRILAFDKLGISLKQTAINLKWYRIQDLPIHYSSEVKPDEIDMILDYNMNDVLITRRLYEEITPLRELRSELSILYDVDLSSASDSRMANLILEQIYTKEEKVNLKNLREMRTEREKVFVGDCIADFIVFTSTELKELLERISSTIVYAYNDFRYSESIQYAGCNFLLGIGGLHTKDEPGVFANSEDFIIQDMDVASYYPNLIINNNFYPKHLGEGFIRVLKKITEERITAKKSGYKVKADGLKITVNSLFGKLGSKTFWLYDPKQMLSTTISGQLGLLMLVEGLHNAGIGIISCNTDGVVCKIPKNLESKYYEIAKNWETLTGLELEFTPYKKYIRRDVNSYITEKKDGKTKEKGVFLKEVDLKKSFHMPIVAKALYSYFISGITVRETLNSCRDIMEFCISQKSGSDFEIELHTINGIKKLQKTNRFFISRKGGTLIKRGGVKKTIGLYVGSNVTVLNTFDPKVPFEEYDVNLAFYEREVMKIIDLIEPKQDSLFDLGTLDNGVKTKNTFKPVIREELPKAITVKSLNKLPRDEMMDSLKDIVSKNECLNGISPRYVYVVSFNTKSLMAEVYCLAKGVIQELEVDKSAYKKSKMEAGQLVLCTRFSKYNGLHIIAEYKITDKIEEDNKTLI